MGWLVFNTKTQEVLFFSDWQDVVAYRSAHHGEIGNLFKGHLATEMNKSWQHGVYIQVNPGRVV